MELSAGKQQQTDDCISRTADGTRQQASRTADGTRYTDVGTFHIHPDASLWCFLAMIPIESLVRYPADDVEGLHGLPFAVVTLAYDLLSLSPAMSGY